MPQGFGVSSSQQAEQTLVLDMTINPHYGLEQWKVDLLQEQEKIVNKEVDGAVSSAKKHDPSLTQSTIMMTLSFPFVSEAIDAAMTAWPGWEYTREGRQLYIWWTGAGLVKAA